MKRMIGIFVSLASFSAQAQSGDAIVKCFKANGKTAMIQASAESVHVDYDLKSDAGYTKEYGTPSSYEVQDGRIDIEVFLQSVLDGSDVRIQISPRAVSFQGLSSGGAPLEEPNNFRVVKCPF